MQDDSAKLTPEQKQLVQLYATLRAVEGGANPEQLTQAVKDLVGQIDALEAKQRADPQPGAFVMIGNPEALAEAKARAFALEEMVDNTKSMDETMTQDRTDRAPMSPEQVVKGTAFREAMMIIADTEKLDTETVFAACFMMVVNQLALYCDETPVGKDASIGLCRNVELASEIMFTRAKKMRRQLENGEPFELPK